MLCIRCQEIFKRPPFNGKELDDLPEFVTHSEDIQTVLDGGNMGCQICGMLCRHFNADIYNQPEGATDLEYKIRVSINKTIIVGFIYSLLWYAGENSIGSLDLELYDEDVIVPYLGDVDLHNDSSPTMISNTSSSESWRQVSAWMEECLNCHVRCNEQNTHSSWRPTRLLEIGTPTSAFAVRLIETANTSPLGPYLTLSHCWGEAQFMTLTMGNLEELKSGFSIERLPKTFQDAITVTKRLTHSLLWIDSLCIIQDSVEDWNAESAQMSQVYQHAVCNIAATGAFDSSEGLFFDRNIKILQHCKNRVPSFDQRGFKTIYVTDEDLWARSVEASPLIKRAWVVQERLLARRILHFTRDELFWECAENCACELYPKGIPEKMISNGQLFKHITLSSSITDRVLDSHGSRHYLPNSLESNEETENSIWSKVLNNYSKARLTKSKDKEAALAGVVKVLEKTFANTYIAGLWVNSLTSQLLWQSMHSDPLGGPVNYYRAPTWSWLSIDGEVLPYREPYGKPGARYEDTFMAISTVSLEDFNITRSGSSLISPIVRGSIKLRGVLRPLSWVRSTQYFASVTVSGLANGCFWGHIDQIDPVHLSATSHWGVVIEAYQEEGKYYGHGLLLLYKSQGVYQRVGIFLSRRDNGLSDILGMLSKRHQDILQGRRSPLKPYSTTVSTYSSPEGFVTKVSQAVSKAEIEERESATDEEVFTII